MKLERYALLLGSSKFKDNNYNKLDCIVNDIDGVRANLLKYGDFKEENIKVLLDEDVNYSREEIEEFLDRVKKNDFILFYYSGHGELDRDTNKLYFIMNNTKRERLKSTSIDKDFIYDCLEKYKPKVKVFYNRLLL